MATKILYIHGGADLYGASRVVLRIVRRLDKKVFDPCVILPYEGPLADALRAEGVHTVIMKSLSVISRRIFHSWRIIPFLFMIPLSVIALWRFMKRENIALVHTNTGIIVSAGLAARLAGIPHIWHVHDSFHEFRRLWKLYSKYILWSSDKVVCVSTAIAKQFDDDEEKVAIIHVGIPVEELQNVSEEAIREFRDRYELDNKRTVGVVGRIKFQRKGQDFFVKAIGLLKNKSDNVKYLIVGSPFPGNESHLTNLQRLIKEVEVDDLVVLTGDVEKTAVVYHALDVLVFPSCFPEPFGAVVLEAMAAGTPVIGTAIGGTVEQIEDGVSGILVEPNNPQMLAEKIELLLSNRPLYESIREAARQRVRERFHFERMCQRMEQLYGEVLG